MHVVQIGVHAVARRARNVGDDHALLAQHAVEQAGLAHVRLADQGDTDALLFFLILVRGRDAASSSSPTP